MQRTENKTENETNTHNKPIYCGFFGFLNDVCCPPDSLKFGFRVCCVIFWISGVVCFCDVRVFYFVLLIKCQEPPPDMRTRLLVSCPTECPEAEGRLEVGGSGGHRPPAKGAG